MLHRPCLRHPLRTILLGVVLTVAAGSGVARLELDTDGRLLLDPGAPEVLFDREVRATFDAEDRIVVVVETAHPAGIWNRGTLGLVARLTAGVAALPAVDPAEVVSLATERGLPPTGVDALAFRGFLDPVPQTPEEIERVRAAVAGLPLYRGTLVAHDDSAAAILIGVEAEADRPALTEQVRTVIAAQGAVPETLHVVGAPVAESLLGAHVLGHLATLVPLTLALMGLLFYLRYRSLAAVLLPLTEIGACLLFVFGLMGHAGVPVSLPTIVLPVILTAVGVADEIYVFDRYARTGDLGATMEELWRPMLRSALTTAVAFLSFTLSPVAPVRHFGLFTAVGVLFCMAWSHSVIPAGLALCRPPRRQAGEAWPGRFRRLGGWALRHRRRLLAATALAVLVLATGARRVVVEDSWLSGFAPGSDLRRSTARVEELFHGSHVLLVRFDAGPGTPAGTLRPIAGADGIPAGFTLSLAAPPGLDPSALVGEQVPFRAVPRALAAGSGRRPDLTAEVTAARRRGSRVELELTPLWTPSRERFLASRPAASWSFEAPGERLTDPRMLARLAATGGFLERRLAGRGGVLAPTGQLAAARSILTGERVDGKLEETPAGNRFLMTVLGHVRGPERLEETFDGSRRQGLITVFLKDPTFASVARLLADLEGYAQRELEPAGVRLGFAGDVAVSQSMIAAIVATQVRSLVLSLLGIFAVAALLGRSLRLGALCLVPPALAVLASFAVMGWAGVPLGVATSMFAAMTLGLGVDFAIHLADRARRAGGVQALGLAGPPIATSTAALAVGLGVLAFSPVPAIQRLGALLVVSIVTCSLVALVLLPLLLGRGQGVASSRDNG